MLTKEEYFESINECLTDEIYITESLDEFLEETGMNQRMLMIDSETAKNVEVSEIVNFLKAVIKNRKIQLDESNKKVALLFYMWFDDLSGYLSFDFINSKHNFLPFSEELTFVSSMEEIVGKFLDSDYLAYLVDAPLEELNNNKKEVLPIYKEII